MSRDLKFKLATLVCGALAVAGSSLSLAATPNDNAKNSVAVKSATADQSVNRQKQQGDDEAKKTLVADAVTAITETKKANEDLAQGKAKDALAALERATGKLDLLLARNPAAALLPVSEESLLVQTAPPDVKSISGISDRAKRALDNKDLGLARLLLASLQDEVRVRVYSLPLATYPQAIKDAARLIDEKKFTQANESLTNTLRTLVAVDYVYPVPLLTANTDVSVAEKEQTSDRNGAEQLLADAKLQLDRAEALGYAGKADSEFAALNKSLSDTQDQLKATKNQVSFKALKDRLAAFYQRQSQSGKTDSGR